VFPIFLQLLRYFEIYTSDINIEIKHFGSKTYIMHKYPFAVNYVNNFVTEMLERVHSKRRTELASCQKQSV